jgi:putative ABC transport system permease protein
MRYMHLIWSGIVSRKFAYLASFLALAVCFVLSFYMLAFSRAMTQGVQFSGTKRLVTWHKTSIIEMLPLSYIDRIAKLEQVDAITHRTFFGGYYRDPSNQLPMWAVDAKSFVDYYREYTFGSPAERADFLAGGNAIAVGRSAAASLGWKLGDLVPVHSIIWIKKDDSDVWDFRVAAIFDSTDESSNTRQVFIPYGPFNDARAFGTNSIGYVEVLAKTESAAPLLAKQIDAMFENSEKPTRTSTLSGFLQSFTSQIADISNLIYSAMSIVLFTVLLMLTGQFAHGFALRRREFGVLKAIGYDNAVMTGLIVAESVALSVSASLVALFVARVSIKSTNVVIGKFVSGFYQAPIDVVLVLALAVAMGLIASLLPAMRVRAIMSAET